MMSNSGALIPIEDALAFMLESDPAVAAVECNSIKACLNRVLAQEIRSPINVPPFDNSAMDGYAINAQDALLLAREGRITMPVSQRVSAGDAPEVLASNSAARIFTGASLPPKADTVIIQENVEVSDRGITFSSELTPHQNVRRSGQDVRMDAAVFKVGTLLGSAHLGVLASLGFTEVKTYRPIKVGFFSTGDELLEPGEPLTPGKIYNSNRYMLSGLLAQFGVEPIDLGVLPDDIEQTRHALESAADNVDMIISTGGVSVGEEDHIKEAVASLGELKLWKLAIKPGKPLSFGRVCDCPFVGLPGNPAAVWVTTLMIVRPMIKSMMGLPRQHCVAVPERFRANFTAKSGGRQEYLRAQASQDDAGVWWLSLYPNQSSGVLSSACWADALAVRPIRKAIEQGDWIDGYRYRELLS